MQPGIGAEAVAYPPIILNIGICLISCVCPRGITGNSLRGTNCIIAVCPCRKKGVQRITSTKTDAVGFTGTPVKIGTEYPVVDVVACLGDGM